MLMDYFVDPKLMKFSFIIFGMHGYLRDENALMSTHGSAHLHMNWTGLLDALPEAQ